jgi:streptomycin 3"-adenylyltransferase
MPGDDQSRDGVAGEVVEEVVGIVRDVLGEALVGAYLHGSAVLGGLRPTSDIDVLAVIDRETGLEERRAIVDRLLGISGRRAYRGPGRPVELTIVITSAVRPWRYPPRTEFQYGEWLRDDYEAGRTPEPGPSPDLAPLIAMTLAGAAAGQPPLMGPPATDVFDPVPPADLRRAIVAGVPGLIADLETDTRNVLLTLARVWATLATDTLQSKDAAAAWAVDRLPEAHRPVLVRARSMYLEGRDEDDWGDMKPAVRAHADLVVAEIQRLAGPRR